MATPKTESPVAAAEADNPDKDAVKEQERVQAEELKAGKSTLSGPEKAAAKLIDDGPAAARAGVGRDGHVQGGFMDQLSRRSAADALEGHMVTLDLSDKGVQDAYRSVNLVRDKDSDLGEYNHVGNYGVYLEPQVRDPDTGIPVTALVQLRDDTHAKVVVPYEALSPASARGR